MAENWIETGEYTFETENTFNNGEFDYKFVISMIDMDNACGDVSKGKFMGNLSVVKSPKSIPKKEIKQVAKSMGVKESKVTYADLAEYGICANVENMLGDDYDKVVEILKEKISIINMMFGFFMDRPLNSIGSTGWDFLNGDILAGMKKNK